MTENKQEIGENLEKNCRAEFQTLFKRHLNKGQAAKALGIEASRLSKWLSGVLRPQADQAGKMADDLAAACRAANRRADEPLLQEKFYQLLQEMAVRQHPVSDVGASPDTVDQVEAKTIGIQSRLDDILAKLDESHGENLRDCWTYTLKAVDQVEALTDQAFRNPNRFGVTLENREEVEESIRETLFRIQDRMADGIKLNVLSLTRIDVNLSLLHMVLINPKNLDTYLAAKRNPGQFDLNCFELEGTKIQDRRPYAKPVELKDGKWPMPDDPLFHKKIEGMNRGL